MADAISRQAFSDLVGSIYDCALDPSRWDQTLADVSEALDCFALLLALSDLRRERFLIHKRVGVEPYQFERLSIYLPESPLNLGRNERQGLITDREIELGKLLLPRLRRAVTISKVLDVRTRGGDTAEALDALRCAVALTNEHGTILHTNRAAKHVLDQGGPIQNAQGVLQATVPSAASELRAALAFAASNEARIGKTGLAIRPTEPDVPPIIAHVLPLTGSAG